MMTVASAARRLRPRLRHRSNVLVEVTKWQGELALPTAAERSAARPPLPAPARFRCLARRFRRRRGWSRWPRVALRARHTPVAAPATSRGLRAERGFESVQAELPKGRRPEESNAAVWCLRRRHAGGAGRNRWAGAWPCILRDAGGDWGSGRDCGNPGAWGNGCLNPASPPGRRTVGFDRSTAGDATPPGASIWFPLL